MKRLILSMLCIILCCISIYAQSDVEQIVRLKDGSQIIGNVTEGADEVTVQTSDGITFVFYRHEIASIQNYKAQRPHFKKGFQMSVSAGAGVNWYEDVATTFRLSAGNRFNHTNYLGAVIGIEIDPYYWSKYYKIPLNIEYRLYPCARKKSVQPFMSLSSGIIYSTEGCLNDHHLFANAEFGFGINISLDKKQSSNKSITIYHSIRYVLDYDAVGSFLNISYTF